MLQSLATLIGLSLLAAPATALDAWADASQPGTLWLPASHVPEWALPMEAEDEHEAEGWLDQLYEQLRAIPLRPVAIGESPRRPDDPQQGAGVVLKIPW